MLYQVRHGTHQIANGIGCSIIQFNPVHPLRSVSPVRPGMGMVIV
jgi:hypothetical protein